MSTDKKPEKANEKPAEISHADLVAQIRREHGKTMRTVMNTYAVDSKPIFKDNG